MLGNDDMRGVERRENEWKIMPQRNGRVKWGIRFPNRARGEGWGLRGCELSRRHRHHSPKARQKSRKASWAWTPQAWSFNRGGNSLTSASRASTLWDLEEEVEEEEEEEGKAEGVLLPEEDREVEVSTGEEAVREGVMEKESIEENRKSKQGDDVQNSQEGDEWLRARSKNQIGCNK